MTDPLPFLDHVVIHLYDSLHSGHITDRVWIQSVAVVNKACRELSGDDLNARFDIIYKEENRLKEAQVEDASQDLFNFYPEM